MLQLPPALAAFAKHKRFILCKYEPSAKRPGKTDKFPVDYRTAIWPVNAHNPDIWTDAATACQMAGLFNAAEAGATAKPSWGVGFVFTPDVGMWFIDLDDALVDGRWSPYSVSLCERLRGCAVEVSQSGRGLHLFGTGPVPPHSCDSQLFTENRFVALTGTQAAGDAGARLDDAIASVVADFFPPKADRPELGEWTDGPCDGWGGSTDDAELLRMMLSARPTAAQLLGSRISTRDLWEGNPEALAAAFPDPNRGYDGSRADFVLAQRLAWWTGKDCTRIERLMRQSALVRERWDIEPGWLTHRCILPAVAGCSGFATGSRAREPAAPVAPAAGSPQVGGYVGGNDYPRHFAGCVYITAGNRALVPGGRLLKPDQFSVHYGGTSYVMDDVSGKTTRTAWEAFTNNGLWRAPRVDDVCFRPTAPTGAILHEEGRDYVNIYEPIETPRAAGDPSRFVEHVTKLLPDPDDRAKLMAYMAAVVQHPGVKFQWAPMLQGMEGNGKTLLLRAVRQAVGERYSHMVDPNDITNKFNSWVQGKLFVGIEEIHVADKAEVIETLKPLITNSRVPIQGKGLDQVTGDNCANFMFMSNHKDAVKKTRGDRRYGIFYTAQQEDGDLERWGMDGDYFPDLYNWLNGNGPYEGQPAGWHVVAEYLHTYQIPDALNPAVAAHRAPTTTSTQEAIGASLGTVEQSILEEVARGTVGFAGGWISSAALEQLLDRGGMLRRMSHHRRREMLRGLKYEPHPGLPGGRAPGAVLPDGAMRPVLYVTTGHLARQLTGSDEIVGAYSRAQGGALGVLARGMG